MLAQGGVGDDEAFAAVAYVSSSGKALSHVMNSEFQQPETFGGYIAPGLRVEGQRARSGEQLAAIGGLPSRLPDNIAELIAAEDAASA